TVCPALGPVLTTTRYPSASRPRSLAICLAARWSRPIRAASSSARSLIEATCLVGMSSTWVGAWGLISSKASRCSSRNTSRVGISLRVNLQKRHSAMAPPGALALVADRRARGKHERRGTDPSEGGHRSDPRGGARGDRHRLREAVLHLHRLPGPVRAAADP